jgi:hypothetical protein
MLFTATWAVSTESESYAEMAALETDEWSPKHNVAKEGAELGEAQKSKEGPSPSETSFDENADENNPTSLFPGPVYGLPGYKESHDWLKDLDWWSPLVFDWRYYKARCADGCAKPKTLDSSTGEYTVDAGLGDALKDMGEGEIKKYWLEKGMDYRDVASPTFNCEYYVKQNPELHEELLDDTKHVKCKEAVKHFLTAGVFDGLSGTTYDGKIVTDGADKKSHWKTQGHKCLAGCVPGQITWDKNYAWTFWYMRTTKIYDRQNPKVMPVFSVRTQPGTEGRHKHGWWGGYPFFITWVGSMMFCASTDKWECHWPIGEENNGVKGGWRFNWYHRWRLPPINWWRFFGVMVDEDGYTLYEFSDPPILGNNKLHAKANHGQPYTVHGFSRRIATKTKGSWWGYDIHAPYHRPDGLWNPNIASSAGETLPETCTKESCHIRCWQHGWHSNRQCRIDNTVEECGYCKEVDGKIQRDSGSGSFTCKCTKEWDKVKKIGMSAFSENDARIWTGYTYAPWQCPHCRWHWSDGKDTPQYIMDLTYYRLADHTFTAEEMQALYMKGRSIEPLTTSEMASNRGGDIQNPTPDIEA